MWKLLETPEYHLFCKQRGINPNRSSHFNKLMQEYHQTEFFLITLEACLSSGIQGIFVKEGDLVVIGSCKIRCGYLMKDGHLYPIGCMGSNDPFFPQRNRCLIGLDYHLNQWRRSTGELYNPFTIISPKYPELFL